MNKKSIIFFADRLPPEIGGMETHAEYFINFFNAHDAFEIKAIISKKSNGNDCVVVGEQKLKITLLEYLGELTFTPDIIFFNSGRWIEEFNSIRTLFPNSKLVYRTGGNEIIKAPLSEGLDIPKHSDRQSYWKNNINDNIDILITNSGYTEQRLMEVGINREILRKCVGGVSTSFIKTSNFNRNENTKRVFLCASRFVHYKNHDILIDVFNELRNRKYDFTLNLVGDGLLLDSIKEKVKQFGLENYIVFKGVFSNQQVLDELLRSDYYIQLSSEYETKVSGGSYLHSEGMGRSIIEAISCGTFVISSFSGAIPEVINDNTGALVQIENRQEIIETIEKLLLSMPKPNGFTDKYSWGNYFKLYEEIFSE